MFSPALSRSLSLSRTHTHYLSLFLSPSLSLSLTSPKRLAACSQVRRSLCCASAGRSAGLYLSHFLSLYISIGFCALPIYFSFPVRVQADPQVLIKANFCKLNSSFAWVEYHERRVVTGSFLEPSGCSWSHYVGIFRHKLTNVQNLTFD